MYFKQLEYINNERSEIITIETFESYLDSPNQRHAEKPSGIGQKRIQKLVLILKGFDIILF